MRIGTWTGSDRSAPPPGPRQAWATLPRCFAQGRGFGDRSTAVDLNLPAASPLGPGPSMGLRRFRVLRHRIAVIRCVPGVRSGVPLLNHSGQGDHGETRRSPDKPFLLGNCLRRRFVICGIQRKLQRNAWEMPHATRGGGASEPPTSWLSCRIRSRAIPPRRLTPPTIPEREEKGIEAP
jgi:hypothetical protein